MKIGTWLLSLVQPFIAKILLALGFSVVTITGFEAAIGQVKSQLVGSVNALPVDMLNVFLLAGGGKGIGIILAAVAVKVMLWQISSATKILGANPQ
ncbi:hypothetical protein CBP36_09490 [Acidovorax carolinensis]|uniref:Cobalt ABC transporter permease n=1 Tax=Acidovorax carolinensis TaxID=553814 RepID=A0A240UDF4_9BURK|nr:DUF2523 family protein [Acidovorax carolinensis]ART55178.1 hypothetical protein CBP35_09440 [Acidovorax carolinensis]ART59050.1 hypothetical protein CBP36_09490 [Acidovorax carolinensis]